MHFKPINNNTNHNNHYLYLLLAFLVMSFIQTSDNAIASVSPLLLIENKALNIVCNYTNQEGQHVMVEWKWFKEEVPYDSFTPEDKQRITRDSKDGSLFISKANKKY
ncbi:unnamed protein product, partial [Medioppia subpectinata]